MVRPFPPIELQTEKNGDDNNPAIRLFGRRFFADQTVSELLLELLLVATSQKEIGDVSFSPAEVLPTIDLLRSWPPHEPLKYAPKAHLNLKLFVFLRLQAGHPACNSQGALSRAYRNPDPQGERFWRNGF